MGNIFTEKSCGKYAPKASPRPLVNFGKNPKQPLHSRIFFEKQDILKED